MSYACPICASPLEPMPCYPHHVCGTCDVSLSDGFVAPYADTGGAYDSHASWIDGIPCHADEHRFGGTVIEVLA